MHRGYPALVGGLVGVGLAVGEHGPVDAVPGHQLGGLGGECFGLGRGNGVVFGLGQELTDPVEHGGVAGHRGFSVLGRACGKRGPDLVSGPRFERLGYWSWRRW